MLKSAIFGTTSVISEFFIFGHEKSRLSEQLLFGQTKNQNAKRTNPNFPRTSNRRRKSPNRASCQHRVLRNSVSPGGTCVRRRRSVPRPAGQVGLLIDPTKVTFQRRSLDKKDKAGRCTLSLLIATSTHIRCIVRAVKTAKIDRLLPRFFVRIILQE